MSKKGGKGYSLIGILMIIFLYFMVNMIINPADKDVEDTSDIQESTSTISVSDEAVGDWVLASVVRVVDGDTIIVYVDGEDWKVRLSGIDTPESVGKYEDKPEFYGKEASRFTTEMLEGQEVYLEFDVKEQDQYDRYLAYVWLREPNEEQILVTCINAILIYQGYAEWFDDYENKKYASLFKGFEEQAREDGLGLWSKK